MKSVIRLTSSLVVVVLVLFAVLSSVSAAPQAMPPANCTYTVGYWKNHASDWPVQSLVLGNTGYNQQQLLDILNVSPQGDATYILGHQLIAAKLNIAGGADGSGVAQTIVSSDNWLIQYPLGSNPQGAPRQTGIDLGAILDDYNNGRIGPGHCGDTPPTVVPTRTPSPVPPTETPFPTSTPTNTSVPPTTPTKTPGPTGTPVPTKTPGPTSTPIPTKTPGPTSTVRPTETPVPTSTAAPTETPFPTSVPTRTPSPVPPTETPFPTSTPTSDPRNCTYTQGYWKNHPSAWPTTTLMIGGTTYTQTQLLAILDTSPEGDATYILAHQLIAAKLNILYGADGTAVQTTVTESDVYLTAHPMGSNPTDPDREQGVTMANTLDQYNNGVIGPGHCD